MSILHVGAMELPTGFAMTDIVAWQSDGIPVVMGAKGTDPLGKRTVVIGTEAAVAFAVPRTKAAMELLHVERFRVDCRARGSGDPISEIRPARDDPPDFLLKWSEWADSPVGLECTRFADEERLRADANLTALREAILREPRSRVRSLAGSVVRVHFVSPDPTQTQLPFKPTDPKLAELVTLILRLDPKSSSLQDGPTPNQLPGGVALTTPSTTSGATIATLPPDHRPSRFMERTGFELHLSFTTSHNDSSTHDRLSRIVERKDVEANSILLVTAGGPDRDGLIHPAEEIVAQVLFEGTGPFALQPTHLRLVILHRWGMGDAWELFPTVRQIVRPPVSSLPLMQPPRG
jgi:hypothetical protein